MCVLNNVVEVTEPMEKQSTYLDELRAEVYLGCEGSDTQHRGGTRTPAPATT
jgi:hypothetical protein